MTLDLGSTSLQTRTRRAAALVATALFSLVLGIAAPPASAQTAPVLAYEAPTGNLSTGMAPSIQWGQSFRSTSAITVASVALRQAGTGAPMSMRIDVATTSGQVLATGSGPTVVDGGGFVRLNLNAPVALQANTTYVLRITGISSGSIVGASPGGYPNGVMSRFDTTQFNSTYAAWDIMFRLYDEPAAVTAPTISVPANRVVEANTTGGATTPLTVTAAAGATPITPVCNPSLTGVFPLGATIVTCTATGSTGLTATGSFTVTVLDTAAPGLAPIADVVVEATSPAGAAAAFTASATDVADATPTVACSTASGSTFALGTTAVTCTATDDSGNTASDSFTVTVADTTAPALAPIADVVVEATSPAGAAAAFTASATDVADATPTVACSTASGSTFALGTTAVTCTATDDSGNTASDSFTVTVVDTKAPVLSGVADLAVDATSAAGAVARFTPTATDAADATPTVACDVASGSTFAIGTTAVTCTATDDSGNASSETFTVTVRGAAQQLQVLEAAVTGVGSGDSLSSKVREIEALVARGDKAGARGALKAFTNQVRAQTGKKLTTSTAAELLAAAERISAVLA